MMGGDMMGGNMMGGNMMGGDMMGGNMMGGNMMGGNMMGGDMMGGEEIMCISEQDCDGDGTLATVDCDDNNPLVFPGAPELCDGIDNSCNDEIDELVTSCYTGPIETLGRGVCQAGLYRCVDGVLGGCEMEVTPSEERCDINLSNGVDDDCDGVVDEGCDLDNDGFTVDGGDCNDRDPNISPNVVEVCNGVDDNCNRQIDEVVTSCYDGPNNTLDIGLCQNGRRLCINQELSQCQGQITPIEEACDTEEDEDCDGQIDEGCNVNACSVINRNVPILVSNTCLTAGVFSRALVQVQPTLFDGSPVPDGVSFSLNSQPSVTISSSGVENGIWYWEIIAPQAPTELNLSVRVDCEGNEQTTLTQRPVIQVLPRTSPENMSAPFTIGGCNEPSSNLYIEVFDEASGEMINNASVMVGDEPVRTLQREAASAVRDEVGFYPNTSVTNNRGRASFYDYNGSLSNPINLTVGAEGYENISIFGVEGGHVAVYLRQLAHSQSGRDEPTSYQLRGSVSDFNTLASDGDTDLSLVLPSLGLDELTTKPITQLLSRFECWRPVIISPEVLIPGNLFVPNQREGILLVSQHNYRIKDHDRPSDHVIALNGKINTNTALQTLSSGGATAADLLTEVSFKEIGVRLNSEFSPQRPMMQTATQIIPLSIDLNESLAECTVSGAPSGSYVSCISAGEWTENGVGTGRVFPMGITNFTSQELENGTSSTRRISHASLVGELSNIYYLSTALAISDNNDDGLKNASSAIIDRTMLGPSGGRLSFDSFLGLVDHIDRDNVMITWDDVTTITAPSVDACEVEILVNKAQSYNPGNCSGDLIRQSTSALWSAYLPGAASSITYPTLPSTWPRASSGGLLSDAELSNNESLGLRIRCSSFSEPTLGRFSNVTWSHLIPTHVTVNQVAY
jgi:hypothetical protein